MLPVFFPSTYISQETLKSCFKWFDQMVIYQPSDLDIPDHYQLYQKKQQLLVQTPLAEHFDTNRLKQERIHLQNIGRELGPGLSNMKGMSEKPPYFDDLSVNNIRSQIKRDHKRKKDITLKPLLVALFFHLVQDTDRQQIELNQQLASVEHSEKQLYQMLTDMDNGNITMPLFNPQKIHHAHPSVLLKNWFFLHQHNHEKTGIFITDNPDVLSEIQEWNPDIQLSLTLGLPDSDPGQSQKILWKNLIEFVHGKNNLQTSDIDLQNESNEQLQIYTQKGFFNGPFMPEINEREDQEEINNICIIMVNGS